MKQSGTYWYHSHSGFQEQQGVYGPLVIEPREPDPVLFDREHVVMLTDWTDEHPERVFKKLKKQSDYYNFRQRTLATFIRDVKDHGFSATLAERRRWGQMRMSATDLADVTGYTYTYLMNGHAPAGNWTGLFTPGEKVRLRFINGSAMSYFDVRIPGLKMTVVAADGLPVRPVSVDEFRIAVAETFDVDRRALRAGRLHDLRAGHGPHGFCCRHARHAGGPVRAGARPRPATRADDGRHGARRDGARHGSNGGEAGGSRVGRRPPCRPCDAGAGACSP